MSKWIVDIHGDIEGDYEIIEEYKEPNIGHCEECKHFRKLPYHADKLGRCIQHTGLCPKSDWYCADYEPQESEVEDV